MGDEQLRAFQKVSCLCGAQIRVDPANPDRHVTCPSCDNTFDFVVTMDALKKRSRVSIVLSRAAMKTEGESLGKASAPPRPAPPPPPSFAPSRGGATEGKPPPKAPTKVARKPAGRTIRAVMGQCECGTSFPLEDTGELTTVQSCPECKRSYHVVFKIDPATKEKAAIIVPDKPLARRTMAPAKPPSPPSPARTGKTVKVDPAESRVTDFFTPEKKGRTKVPKARTIPPGAQGVPCPCGEVFVVRRKDLDKEMTCEGCGVTSSFQEVRDPQTLAPVIRIRKK